MTQLPNYHKNKKLKVINLWGGPGAGKSLNAAGLFHKMKLEYLQVEYSDEYAKHLVWSDRRNMFTEQDYIFAKQNNKLRRLVGKVDYAIVDSPLAIGMMYLPNDYPITFAPFVMEVFNSYNNVNIFIDRKHPYDPVGRNQTEDQAKQIDDDIIKFLERFQIPYHRVESSEDTSEIILSYLKEIEFVG